MKDDQIKLDSLIEQCTDTICSDPHLTGLMGHGELFEPDPANSFVCDHPPGLCHQGTIFEFENDKSIGDRLYTGFARLHDGEWFRHSWIIDKQGRVVEPCKDVHSAYFGVPLEGVRSCDFFNYWRGRAPNWSKPSAQEKAMVRKWLSDHGYGERTMGVDNKTVADDPVADLIISTYSKHPVLPVPANYLTKMKSDDALDFLFCQFACQDFAYAAHKLLGWEMVELEWYNPELEPNVHYAVKEPKSGLLFDITGLHTPEQIFARCDTYDQEMTPDEMETCAYWTCEPSTMSEAYNEFQVPFKALNALITRVSKDLHIEMTPDLSSPTR